jgi:hypothetical protein
MPSSGQTSSLSDRLSGHGHWPSRYRFGSERTFALAAAMTVGTNMRDQRPVQRSYAIGSTGRPRGTCSPGPRSSTITTSHRRTNHLPPQRPQPGRGCRRQTTAVRVPIDRATTSIAEQTWKDSSSTVAQDPVSGADPRTGCAGHDLVGQLDISAMAGGYSTWPCMPGSCARSRKTCAAAGSTHSGRSIVMPWSPA